MNNSLANTLEMAGSVTTEKLEEFAKKVFPIPVKYAVVSLSINAVDPLAYLNRFWKSDTFQYYWEEPSNGFAIAAGGETINTTASGPNRFRSISSQIDSYRKSIAECSLTTHSLSGPLFLGGFSFFNTVSGDLWKSFQPASFTVPQWMIIKDGPLHLLTLSAKLDSFHSPEELHRYLLNEIEDIKHSIEIIHGSALNKPVKAVDDDGLTQNGTSDFKKWTSSIKKAKSYINRNEFNKIVLARHLTLPAHSESSPAPFINTLRQQYKSCYNFLIHRPDNTTFLGSTPEKLASFRENRLSTEALAGSIQRGETAAADLSFANDLRDSSKNQHEHHFVVKDIEQRLKPFVNHFERHRQPEIRKLSNVQHLYTPIRARLNGNTDMLAVIEKLHPTPAVGGYPWKKAAPYIQEFEDFERGWYAGPVGWLNGNNHGQFAVAIRSGLLTKSHSHLYAGCGIVANSDPYQEWNETNLKLKPMLSALQHEY